MKTYPHLMARVFNTPLMIAPDKARAIVAGLATRLGVATTPATSPPVGLPDLDARVPGARLDARKPYFLTDRGVAVISVVGTLAHNAATAEPPSGMTVYSEIEAEIEDAAADPAVRAILLDIDSPGGEASDSAFALADRIRIARTKKPLWAVADETACSAAYLLGCQASRFVVPVGGYVGSIGVYALHLDMSVFDKKEGLTWTYIYAGAHKVDGNPHEPLDDGTRKFLQLDVDRTYDRFVEAVGLGRPSLGAKGARATEARYYSGADAVKSGLIDGVMDFRAALDELTASLGGSGRSIGPRAASSLRENNMSETPLVRECRRMTQTPPGAMATDKESSARLGVAANTARADETPVMKACRSLAAQMVGSQPRAELLPTH